MEATRIIVSGLTGRFGRRIIKSVSAAKDVEVVAGISRSGCNANTLVAKKWGEEYSKDLEWYSYDDIANPLKEQMVDYNVMVDFSDSDAFDAVLNAAVRTKRSLVCGTSNLSTRQIASLHDATNRIPVFWSDTFCFELKQFIDGVVRLVNNEENGRLVLCESIYVDNNSLFEMPKLAQEKVEKKTGKIVELHSPCSPIYDVDGMPCDWMLQFYIRLSKWNTRTYQHYCRVVELDELARNILEIAKVMARKPVQKGTFYDLDGIWGDLPH